MKSFIFLSILIVSCAHNTKNRNPASDDAGPVRRIVHEVSFHPTHPSMGDDIEWTIVRGRIPFHTKTHFERSSDRKFMDFSEQSYVQTWMNLSSTFDRLGYSSKSSMTPQGFYTPYVKIPKHENLECFTTHHGSVLDEKFDLSKIDYKYSILFKQFKLAPTSSDGKYFEIPYGEMNGDQVACRNTGSEVIKLALEYAFLSPIAARFPDRYSEEIKQIQNDPTKFDHQDHFFLQDFRYERIEEVYKKWKELNFVLNREIVNFLGGTVGLYPTKLRENFNAKTQSQKFTAEVTEGSLVEIYINGGTTIQKGIFKHDIKFGPEKISKFREIKEGKRKNFIDPNSVPYSFNCYMGTDKVYDSSKDTFLTFNAPKTGSLSCFLNLPHQYKKQTGNVEMVLTVFDAGASRLVMETFMRDEENFVNTYSKKVEESRLEGLMQHLKKISK